VAEQPLVGPLEMVSGKGEVAVVIGEYRFNVRGVIREPLSVAERRVAVLATVDCRACQLMAWSGGSELHSSLGSRRPWLRGAGPRARCASGSVRCETEVCVRGSSPRRLGAGADSFCS
jgi:hypothetical protein